MATEAEVEEFLRNLHYKMKSFDVAFRPRDKNMNAIAELDILPIKRNEYLKSLTVENYYRGPKKDTENPAKPDYFEFGMIINGIEVYIKLNLGQRDKMIDCISFHKAEDVITYPLRKEKL
jgi:hypothetical protein